METLIREQARLIILKALLQQIDETLNSDLLIHELRPFGIRKSREWVHEELGYLREMGALTTVAVGSVLVATLTEKGHRHLNREIAIEGIQRPSRPGG
ncbi:VpaChn25_0724 family phage protein [Rhodobacter maris]|nr:hypothetical protein [Rhodobacter maris]